MRAGHGPEKRFFRFGYPIFLYLGCSEEPRTLAGVLHKPMTEAIIS
jgi:hypothetical protein